MGTTKRRGNEIRLIEDNAGELTLWVKPFACKPFIVHCLTRYYTLDGKWFHKGKFIEDVPFWQESSHRTMLYEGWATDPATMEQGESHKGYTVIVAVDHDGEIHFADDSLIGTSGKIALGIEEG